MVRTASVVMAVDPRNTNLFFRLGWVSLGSSGVVMRGIFVILTASCCRSVRSFRGLALYSCFYGAFASSVDEPVYFSSSEDDCGPANSVDSWCR